MIASDAAVIGIRRLSGLGLPAREVVPQMLHRLHGAVASLTNSYHWIDADGRLIDYYAEPPYLPDVARQARGAVPGAMPAPAPAPHADDPPEARPVRPPALPPRFHDSEPYRSLWRPRGVHHALEAIVSDGHRPLGLLVLYRGASDPQFSQQDIDTVTALRPLFARACAGSATYDGERAPATPPVFAVIAADGEVQHADAEARLALALALHPCLNLRSCGRGCARADAGVTQHLQSLAAALQADPLQPAMLRVRNHWGQFTLRAHRLQSVRRGAAPLIGVALEHEVALPLAVDAALERSALSSRQRELCMLLVQGCSYAAAGEQMGISEQTAISYARVVFHKLGAHNREGLLRRLLLASRA